MERDLSENMLTDTVAAISTSLSPSGIGIVRISGPEALRVADEVFRPGAKAQAAGLASAQGYTLHYGHIYDGHEEVDEVLAGVLRGPHSFTAEDTVEFNCHGGPQVTKRVLELCLTHGARLAEPGEFTKRAFLNGRIDLAQAEAVGELIKAKNETARRASLISR